MPCLNIWTAKLLFGKFFRIANITIPRMIVWHFIYLVAVSCSLKLVSIQGIAESSAKILRFRSMLGSLAAASGY